MIKIHEVEKLKKNFESQVFLNEKLSNYSWFNLGGPAQILFKPKTLEDLSRFLKMINQKYKIRVLGVGSNTLIRDGGYDGIILKLGSPFSRLSLLNSSTLIAGASALDKQVSNYALNNSLSEFEFLSCIPGSIGGAVRMNSGCYGYDISKILVSVQAIDLSGNIKVIKASEINFSYRDSNLDDNLIFISATFKGKKNKKIDIEEKINTLVEKKKKSQPSKIKTCGSTFKNPLNKKAWKLIKDSGCSEMSIGGAKMSEKHCNFFVNTGKAKSKELEKLINKVKDIVLKKTGVNLELEIHIIGLDYE